MGERTVWIDCDVIQGDGGTRTASITGSFIALALAFQKVKKDGLMTRIPLKDYVAAISVGMSNGEFLLDLNYEEDSKADVDMNVVMRGNGEFIEIQGTAERKTFKKDEMVRLMDLAQGGIETLIGEQKKLLKDIVA
jgi:ribonuclease PH